LGDVGAFGVHVMIKSWF